MGRKALLGFALSTGLLAASPAAAEGCAPLTVYFGWNSTVLSEESQRAIENLAVTVAWKGPDLDYLLLTSHTDRTGSAAANRALSQRRAEAVRDLLMAYNVPRDLITIRAEGESQPRVRTGRNVREPRNRRVELLIQMSAAAQARQIEGGAPLC